MANDAGESRIRARLIDALYVEAMLLADEARTYFDDHGRAEREALSPMMRVSFSCESLKVTTRLMHIIAWLLTQRAVMVGELTTRDSLDPSRRLGAAPLSDPDLVAQLPAPAVTLVIGSTDLHRRVARLDDAQALAGPIESPARIMFDRLAAAF
jgi:regulator of CtrA degradation